MKKQKMKKKQKKRNENAKCQYRNYSKEDLLDAYNEVITKHVPIKTTAKKYSVPESTLRDRLKGRISLSTVKSGKKAVLTTSQEHTLVEHLQNMASIGYRYKRATFLKLSTDYALSLGCRMTATNLSYKWLEGFIARSPERVPVKPACMTLESSQAVTKDCMETYYTTLETIFAKHDLSEKPHLIYYVEDSVLTMTETNIKRNKKDSAKGTTSCVTILGGGNAMGTPLPQFFVFPGQTLSSNMLMGAGKEARGITTSDGLLKADVFQTFIEKHLLPHCQRQNSNDYIMLLYDGNMSCVNPQIIDWALQLRVVLYALPPHTQLLLKFLDVDIFGGLKERYLEEIEMHRQQNQHLVLRKADIASICGSAYDISMTGNNLQAAFAETGISPFNAKVVFYCLEDPYEEADSVNYASSHEESNDQESATSEEDTDSDSDS